MTIMQRICKQCGVTFSGGPRAYYCLECRYARQRERENLYKKHGAARQLGSIDKCELCGKDYIVDGGLQRFCKECQEINRLEHDKTTSISYYHENKGQINPKRNTRRQLPPRKCIWCGAEFKKHTKSSTCNTDCKRAYLNKYARDLRRKLKKHKQ